MEGGDPGHAGSGLTRLHTALESADPATRVAAVLQARPGPGVEQALVATLADPDARVRRASVAALARLEGPVATRALIRASATDPSASVRAEAVDALGRLLAQPGGRA